MKIQESQKLLSQFLDAGNKNGRSLLGIRTLKSAVSQVWIDEFGCYFACWYKFWKAKSHFNNYWMGMVKNGSHGTFKIGASHKWFDELSRLVEWFLHADSDGIIFYSVSLTSKC